MTVNGFAAPLFAIANINGQEQINLAVPYEVAGQAIATWVVNNNGAASAGVDTSVLPAHPGIFTVDGRSGTILHGADFTLVSASSPAGKGEAVVLYAAGLGPVSPAVATGAAGLASPLSLTTVVPVVTVGGARAQVLFAGLSPGLIALYQVNIVIPLGAPSGELDVVIQVGDQVSQAVKLVVR